MWLGLDFLEGVGLDSLAELRDWMEFSRTWWALAVVAVAEALSD